MSGTILAHIACQHAVIAARPDWQMAVLWTKILARTTDVALCTAP